MNLLRVENYYKDVKVSLNSIVNVEKLKNSSILITGSTGLICSSIIDELLVLNELFDYNIRIYACARSQTSINKRFEKYKDNKNLIYIQYDANENLDFNFKVDYVIHGASNASPELYVKEPVETMLSNIFGMKNLLEFSKNNTVKSLVYISSSEVYGIKENGKPYIEDEYGYIDILNVRSSYSSSKRATETMCISYASEYGLDVKIVRPGHIYGPSAKETDRRISSSFLRAALRGEDLIMKSTGEQIRSYCHSLDCASAILTVLLRGESGEAYNISNKNSIITIKEMAEIISKISNVELILQLPDDLEVKQQNPMTNSSLNSDKLEGLGWKGIFTAEEGFKETYSVLEEYYGK